MFGLYEGLLNPISNIRELGDVNKGNSLSVILYFRWLKYNTF